METGIQTNVLNTYLKLVQKSKQEPVKNLPVTYSTPNVFQSFESLSNSGIAFVNMQNKQRVYTKEQEQKFQQLLDNGKIDKTHLDLFKSIYAQDNISYEEVYKKIADSIGIEYDLPPIQYGEHIQFSDFEPITADFSVNVKFMPYPQIRHELEHVKQNVLLYRAYGKDTMVDITFQAMMRQLIKFNPIIPEYNKMYSELKEEEAKTFRDNYRKDIESKFNVQFYENATRHKDEMTLEEKERASQYLENAYNYDGTSGIMEDEAYDAQIKFMMMLEEFEKVIK